MSSFTITDQEFSESCTNREQMYANELHRAPVSADDLVNRTFMDILGRGRWPIDYYSARVAGYSHPDAMQVERVRIREAAGLPASEPMPPAPTPPVVVPPPVVDVPGVRDNMDRFANFYLQECGRRGWAPDASSTRETRVAFLQDCILLYRPKSGDSTFVMKRAAADRPIGDDVVVFTVDGPDYRRYWDFISGAGAGNWKVSVTGAGEILPSDQLLVDPVTLNSIPG